MDHDADVQVLDQIAITEFPLPQALLGPLALGHFLTQACVGHGQSLGPVADDLFQLLMDCCRRCSEMRRPATTAATANPVSAYRFMNI